MKCMDLQVKHTLDMSYRELKIIENSHNFALNKTLLKGAQSYPFPSFWMII